MFSVIIPLYNKQDFIRRTIDSALNQTFEDFEIILVDDGSTDDSIARLASYSDPRLRVVQQENAGEGAARNRGISESTREWIALLDADDYWFPDHLEALAEMIAVHPQAGMVATSYLQGEEPHARQPGTQSVEIEEIDYFRTAARQIGVVWSSAVALRRSVATRVGGFGPWRTGADLEYWARMAVEAPVVKSNRITAYYFRNQQSITVQEQSRPMEGEAKTLFELWPSVGYVERIQSSPEHSHRRAAFAQYQRNAAYLSMIGFWARGEIDRARYIARSLPGRRLDRAGAVALVLCLPASLLRRIVRFKQRVRRRTMRAR